MPSIVQLEYLLSVDKHRHFGRAAKECNVSQPSLSIQLQKLEAELDVIVFDRSKKPILPTQKGIKVLEQARVIIREHRRLFDIVRSDLELAGDFRLAVIPTLAPYVIPLFVKEFSEDYPKVNLIINEHKTEDIINLLADDYIDGALLVTPLKDDRIIEKSLFYESFHIYVNRNHPFYKYKKIKESQINGEGIWLLNEGHCFRNQVLRVCSLEKRSLPNVNFESGNLETLINLVRKSNGYTLLPYLATLGLSKKEKENNLKNFQGTIPSREVSLVYSRSFLKEDIILALEKVILKNLPSGVQTNKIKKLEIIDI